MIDFSKQALGFLTQLPIKPARQIAENYLLTRGAESLPSEQLRGYAPMRRLRASKYRIVFRLKTGVVKIVLIGKRNDDKIYKMLERVREK